MPVIFPSEQDTDVPYLLLDRLSPTIGWQFRPQARGGPAFMIFHRSPLGGLQVGESFPLTEDGWASAWQALLRRNPDAVLQTLTALRAREGTARGST